MLIHISKDSTLTLNSFFFGFFIKPPKKQKPATAGGHTKNLFPIAIFEWTLIM